MRVATRMATWPRGAVELGVGGTSRAEGDEAWFGRQQQLRLERRAPPLAANVDVAAAGPARTRGSVLASRARVNGPDAVERRRGQCSRGTVARGALEKPTASLTKVAGGITRRWEIELSQATAVSCARPTPRPASRWDASRRTGSSTQAGVRRSARGGARPRARSISRRSAKARRRRIRRDGTPTRGRLGGRCSTSSRPRPAPGTGLALPLWLGPRSGGARAAWRLAVRRAGAIAGTRRNRTNARSIIAASPSDGRGAGRGRRRIACGRFRPRRYEAGRRDSDGVGRDMRPRETTLRSAWPWMRMADRRMARHPRPPERAVGSGARDREIGHPEPDAAGCGG